ncbi:hypothetical protein [Nocardioides sp. Leaf374]|uniref:hypothetical protein n=1 Tax=Nocardioides sp. Leaf374 TaxID=2876560 RepID=UPI001E6201A2|nr:hypothetical protein [Nocardioides sp. Leaf374]
MTDEDQKPQPSRASRALMFVERHAVALASLLGGLIVGGLLGWWVASYVQCSAGDSGCETNVDAVGAAGTWVGGLGTIGAVLFAVVAFRSEESARRQERQLAEVAEADRRRELEAAAEERAVLAADREQRERERAEADARMQLEADAVSPFLKVGGTSSMFVSILTVGVYNANATAVAYKVKIVHPEWGPLPEMQAVAAGRRESYNLGVGTHPVKSTAIPAGWLPHSDEAPAFLKRQAEFVTISFVMHDRSWRKTGSGVAERIDLL